MEDHFQNLIIGSGESGKSLTWTLGKLGQKTACIERSMIGGACPNIACLPSKNVVHSAKVASLFGRALEFGFPPDRPPVDMAAVFRRKREMVEGLVQIHKDKFAASGAQLIMGHAQFSAPKVVKVDLNAGGTRVLTADRIVLDLGSRASLPNVRGLAESKPMTHVEMLNIQRLPAHLIVLGGGYVGLEFAQAMRRFGSRVTIIQHSAKLLDHEDPDISDALLKLMQDEGIEVHLATVIEQVTGQSGERVQLHLQSAGKAIVIDASDILVATGRTPNTDSVDAARGGVELDAHGYIKVDEKLRTTAPDVWATGDCAGSPKFTHVSFDDYRIVRDNFAGGNRTTRDRLIPYCLFTDPEMAHVGLNETQAKSRGIAYRVAKLPMAAVLRTWTLSEKRGFLKALVGDDDRILGFTAFGVEAGELVAAVQTAMIGKMPYTALRDALFTHPTIAEGLNSLFSTVPS